MGSFTINNAGASFTSTSQTLTIGGSFTHSAGTFNPGGGTIALTCGYSCSLTLPASETFNNLTLNASAIYTMSATTLSVTGTLNLVNGGFNQSTAATVDASGPVSVGAGYDGGTATLQLSGSSTRTVTIAAGAVMNSILTLNAANTTVNTSGSGSMSFGTFNLQNGSFNQGSVNITSMTALNLSAGGSYTMGTGTITTLSTLTQSGGTFTGSSTFYISTLNLSAGSFNIGTGTYNSNSTGINQSGGNFDAGTGTISFGMGAAFTQSGGTFYATSAAALTFSGALTINNASASFYSTPNTLTLGGSFVHSAGTFNAGGGTVNLNNGSSQTISGTTTFNNLIITGTSSKTITFPASATITVANALTLKGTGSGNKMYLRSSSNGTQWFINANGPDDIEWVDVKDSNACSGHSIVANASTNSTDNSCWSFKTNGAKNPTYILKGNVFHQGVRIGGQ